MVRLDKILHMITCFKSATPGLEDDQYSTPPKDIKISTDSERVMKRVGVFNNNFDVDINRDVVLESIPYGSCLLYTSPSPRDRTRSRMPSSA